MNRLTAAHIASGRSLRRYLVARVSAAWRNLGTYNEDDVARYLRVVLPQVYAVQRRSAGITNAYLARILGRRVVPMSYDKVVGAAVRNGTPYEEVYRRPFVLTWARLAEGVELGRAVEIGLTRAKQQAETDVQLSMRAALAHVQPAYGIEYYRRVANPGACEFCQSVDGARVLPGAMDLHTGCGCGVVPETRPPTAPLLPASEYHGELGAQFAR